MIAESHRLLHSSQRLLAELRPFRAPAGVVKSADAFRRSRTTATQFAPAVSYKRFDRREPSHSSSVRERMEVTKQIVELLPALRAFSRKLTKMDADAEDLVHDTLVRSLSNLHQFMPGTSLKSWLFTIMRNSWSADLNRRTRLRQMTRSMEIADLSTPPPQPWICASAEVRAAIELLPDEQREALLMIGGMGLSYEEYAAESGSLVGTVKSRLSRARARLAELLSTGPSAELV
jgi:RNA polymerase sigma-70 factor (ECF subfamily)